VECSREKRLLRIDDIAQAKVAGGVMISPSLSGRSKDPFGRSAVVRSQCAL
jgi:hypothetical protein